MKKVFVLSAKIFSLTSVCLCLILFLAACGGGGGGGASLPDSEYTTHNTGGWGGGGGSGGGGNSGSINGTITGSTPLNVTEYTYNGQTYTSVEALKNAIAETAPAGQFTIPFTCTNASNETEIRTARITKTVSGNNTEILIEHQYMASVTVNETPLTIPFYYNDGISLADIAAALGNETVGSGSDEVVFELQKLKIGGAEYGLNGSLPVSANGDVTLNSADIHGVYPKWGISTGNTIQFSSSLNEGDSVVINTTEPIIRIDNPDDKTISLDLRNMNTNNTTFIRNFINSPANVTDLVLPSNITTIANEALSNATNLASVVIPNSTATIGQSVFKDCTHLSSVTFEEPSQLQTIENRAFENCTSLHSVVLPASAVNIQNLVFNGCTNLTVTMKKFPTNNGTGRFTGITGDFTLIFKPVNEQMEIKSIMDNLTAVSGLGNFFGDSSGYPGGNLQIVFDATDSGTFKINVGTFSSSYFPATAVFRFIQINSLDSNIFLFDGSSCFKANAQGSFLNFNMHWDTSGNDGAGSWVINP